MFQYSRAPAFATIFTNEKKKRLKERQYFKLRRAKWRAGVLLVMKGWRLALTGATEVRRGGRVRTDDVEERCILMVFCGLHYELKMAV